MSPEARHFLEARWALITLRRAVQNPAQEAAFERIEAILQLHGGWHTTVTSLPDATLSEIVAALHSTISPLDP